MSELWLEKYRPRDIKEIVGNRSAIASVVKYFIVWSKGKTEKNVMALIGHSGVGKTLTAHLCAKKFGYDLLELNASDYRRKDDIEGIIEPAIHTFSPYGKKAILLDEIDGMTGLDRGGLSSLLRILPDSRIPIIVTANDLSHPKFRGLLEKSFIVQFEPLTPEEMKPFLLHIAKTENADVSIDVLDEIASLSGGDMRVAINMLQSYVTGKALPFYKRLSDAPSLESIFGVEKLERLPSGVDKWFLIHWIYENLPNCIDNPERLFNAIENLCYAEMYSDSIFFIRFLNNVIRQKEKELKRFSFPRSVSLLGATKSRKMVEKEFAMSLGFFLHQSSDGIRRYVLPFLKKFFPKDLIIEILDEVGFDLELRDKLLYCWEASK